MRRLVVVAVLAACGDNAAAQRDAAPPLPDAPPYDGDGPVIDFEEGPEPNGLGVLEASLASAGTIPHLKPIGERLILHGHLTPHADEPDVDTFTIMVTAPTLVRITVEGSGVAGGFRIHTETPTQVVLDRFGITAGTTTSREVFLPVRGTYELSLAASAVWLHEIAGGPASTDATGEYLVTIEQVAVPPASALVTDAGMFEPGETRFYTAPLPAGLSLLSFTIADPRARPALELIDNLPVLNGGPRIDALGDHDGTIELVAGHTGITQFPLIVVEPYYDLADVALPFTFDVTIGSPIPLDFTGASQTITQLRSTPPQDAQETFELAQLWFFGGSVTSFDLAFDHPVRGAIYGGDPGSPAAAFSGLDASAPTWTTYQGIVHLEGTGTYGLFVYDPSGAPTLTVTATVAHNSAMVDDEGDYSTSQLHGMTGFLYDAGTAHPVQTISTSATDTGVLTFSFFDAATFGRLGPLTTSAGILPGPPVVWSFIAGDVFAQRLRTYFSELDTSFVVEVRAASDAQSTVGFEAFDEQGIDLGTLTTAPLARSASVFPGNLPVFAGVHAEPGTPIAIAIAPGDLRVHQLDRYGNVVAENPTTIVQDSSGWTAVSVDAATDPGAEIPFTVTFSAP